MNNVMDIIERFQTHHALQEEHEMASAHASGNGAVAPSAPDKHSIFETEEVRVIYGLGPGRHGMVAAPGWPRSNGRDAGQDRSTAPERQRSGFSGPRDLDPGKQQLQSAQ